MRYTRIIGKATPEALDLAGPMVQFLSSPRGPDAAYCVMLGIIPSGASLPLHSHGDTESPVIHGWPMPPPTKADFERFLKIQSEYGYWNATPDENAAI